MATKPTTIPVEVYLVSPGVPGQPVPKPVLMRPTPLDQIEARYARNTDLKMIRQKVAEHVLITEPGHKVTGVNWAEKEVDGKTVQIAVVYVRQGTPQPPAKPIVPPTPGRRTAVSRRHAKRR